MPSSIQRAPIPVLRPFIQLLRASRHQVSGEGLLLADRERMIPSGCMHVVFRFSEQPIRIFKSIEDPAGDAFYGGVAAGARGAYYVKDIARGASTVGALLQPGACPAMFGIPADEISTRHVALQDLWGNAALSLYNRLQETSDFEQRLQLFELFLAERLPRVCGIHPAIAHALSRLRTTVDIGRIVKETGYSHRHFIKLFRQSVGLSPRIYSRLLRFQQTLKHGFDKTRGRWIDVALEAGYADQPHFNREFREFTGISPSEYLLNRTESYHVPIPRSESGGQFRSIHGRGGEA
jgi:AraC-like DNA-binding protein